MKLTELMQMNDNTEIIQMKNKQNRNINRDTAATVGSSGAV